ALRQGQPFEQVARTYSRDKSAASGGEIPPVFRGRARAVAVPGFEAAAFALQPGETARPTKFLDAWFILRCRERTGASTRPLEAVRDECRRDVAVIKSAAAHGQQISREYQAFRDRAYVQVFWTSYLANLAGSPNQ
ncbi:MAG TPA: peptidylprolyl isomerase, partial [Chthonomonadaceae bacterium]|nr:peptidylprolyl isomerase [Chthonomonadaceae bacterium]